MDSTRIRTAELVQSGIGDLPDEVLRHVLHKAAALDATGSYCAPSFLRSGAPDMPCLRSHFSHATLCRDPFTTYGAPPSVILQVNRRWAGLLCGVLDCVAIGKSLTVLPRHLCALFVRLPHVTVQALAELQEVVSGLHSLQTLVISSSSAVLTSLDPRACTVGFSAEPNSLQHYHLHLSSLPDNGWISCGIVSPSLLSLTLTFPWNLPVYADSSSFTALTALSFAFPPADLAHYRRVQANFDAALAHSLAWIARLPALTVLHLPAYGIGATTPTSAATFSAFSALTRLQDLRYGTDRHRDDASMPLGLILGLRDDEWDEHCTTYVPHELDYNDVSLHGVQRLLGLTRLCVHLISDTPNAEAADGANQSAEHGTGCLYALSCLLDLQHLDLALRRCDDDTLSPLSALTALTALWLHLQRDTVPDHFFGRGLQYLSHPAGLLSLRVSGLPVMSDAFVAALAGFVALTDLSIEHPKTSEVLTNVLAAALEHGDIPLTPMVDTDKIMLEKVLCVVTGTLRSLRLCGLGATLIAVQYLPALERLTLSCMHSLHSVVLCELPLLRKASVVDCDSLRRVLAGPQVADAALSLAVPEPRSEDSAEALRSLLKYLQVIDFCLAPPPERRFPWELSVFEKEAMDLAKHTGRPWRPRLTRLRLRQQDIACYPLLLMPHLQVLHITESLMGHCHALMRTDSLAQLTTLTELHLDVRVGSCTLEHAAAPPAREYAATLSASLPQLSLLRHLRLAGCKLSLQHLQLLAQSLTHLTRLGATGGIVAAEGAPDLEQPASSEDLGAALRPLKCLELLELKAAKVEEGKRSTLCGEYGGSTRLGPSPDAIRHAMGAPSVKIVLY